MLNIFQRCLRSISAERCKQLCDWNFHPLHLNPEFSILYMSCFLIATCNMVHTSHACQKRYRKASGFFLPPKEVRVQANAGAPYQPKSKAKQDLQRWRRDCQCCGFFLSLPPTPWRCVHAYPKTKEGREQQTPWKQTQHKARGTNLVASLLT